MSEEIPSDMDMVQKCIEDWIDKIEQLREAELLCKERTYEDNKIHLKANKGKIRIKFQQRMRSIVAGLHEHYYLCPFETETNVWGCINPEKKEKRDLNGKHKAEVFNKIYSNWQMEDQVYSSYLQIKNYLRFYDDIKKRSKSEYFLDEYVTFIYAMAYSVSKELIEKYRKYSWYMFEKLFAPYLFKREADIIFKVIRKYPEFEKNEEGEIMKTEIRVEEGIANEFISFICDLTSEKYNCVKLYDKFKLNAENEESSVKELFEDQEFLGFLDELGIDRTQIEKKYESARTELAKIDYYNNQSKSRIFNNNNLHKRQALKDWLDTVKKVLRKIYQMKGVFNRICEAETWLEKYVKDNYEKVFTDIEIPVEYDDTVYSEIEYFLCNMKNIVQIKTEKLGNEGMFQQLFKEYYMDLKSKAGELYSKRSVRGEIREEFNEKECKKRAKEYVSQMDGLYNQVLSWVIKSSWGIDENNKICLDDFKK